MISYSGSEMKKTNHSLLLSLTFNIFVHSVCVYNSVAVLLFKSISVYLLIGTARHHQIGTLRPIQSQDLDNDKKLSSLIYKPFHYVSAYQIEAFLNCVHPTLLPLYRMIQTGVDSLYSDSILR